MYHVVLYHGLNIRMAMIFNLHSGHIADFFRVQAFGKLRTKSVLAFVEPRMSHISGVSDDKTRKVFALNRRQEERTSFLEVAVSFLPIHVAEALLCQRRMKRTHLGVPHIVVASK